MWKLKQNSHCVHIFYFRISRSGFGDICGVKKFMCDFCTKNFTNASDKAKHTNRTHSDEVRTLFLSKKQLRGFRNKAFCFSKMIKACLIVMFKINFKFKTVKIKINEIGCLEIKIRSNFRNHINVQ